MKYADAWSELKLWVASEGFSRLQLDNSPLGKIIAKTYQEFLDKIDEMEIKYE